MTIKSNEFTQQFLGVCLATLLPVLLTAFISIPYNLEENPGRPIPSHASIHDLT